jgi:hypothetical protein
VVHKDGRPVLDGAKVLLLNPVDQKVLYETDAVQGAFRFESVAPQSYFVSVKTRVFADGTDAVSVAQDQAVDMGRITLYGWRFQSRFYEQVQVVPAPGSSPWPKPPEPVFIDAHIRDVHGHPVVTVCQYLNLISATPMSYGFGAIVIGILVETPQGSYLRQSCGDSLRSRGYSWPNAIALEEKPGDKIIPGNLDWADFLPRLSRPSDEELDPRDRGGRWAAFFGSLETRDKLVAVPCGNGKLCGYGYGAISAPARLLYRKSHEFGGTK